MDKASEQQLELNEFALQYAISSIKTRISKENARKLITSYLEEWHKANVDASKPD